VIGGGGRSTQERGKKAVSENGCPQLGRKREGRFVFVPHLGLGQREGKRKPEREEEARFRADHRTRWKRRGKPSFQYAVAYDKVRKGRRGKHFRRGRKSWAENLSQENGSRKRKGEKPL